MGAIKSKNRCKVVPSSMVTGSFARYGAINSKNRCKLISRPYGNTGASLALANRQCAGLAGVKRQHEGKQSDLDKIISEHTSTRGFSVDDVNKRTCAVGEQLR